MSDNASGQYNVVLTGQVKTGFTKARVISSVADLFQTSRDHVKPFFQGEKVVVKSHLPHKRAFQYKSKLEELGAQVQLERIHTAEVETSFSMVPDGEEQTPYGELQQRIAAGEKVACGQCGHQQTLAPNCEECGRPLIGMTVPAAPETPEKKASSKMLILGIVVLLLLAGVYAVYYR